VTRITPGLDEHVEGCFFECAIEKIVILSTKLNRNIEKIALLEAGMLVLTGA